MGFCKKSLALSVSLCISVGPNIFLWRDNLPSFIHVSCSNLSCMFQDKLKKMAKKKDNGISQNARFKVYHFYVVNFTVRTIAGVLSPCLIYVHMLG